MDQATQEIQEAQVFRLRMPLRIPYHVSFVRFDAFEVFLARVTLGNGQEGVGEATTSPMDSPRHEAGDLIWDFMQDQTGRLVGTDAGEALRSLEPTQREHPYAAVALATAIETAIHPPEIAEDTRVPLLATVLTHDDEKLEDEIEGHLRSGYRTLKVKVGWDEREDTARTRRIQEIVGDRAIIRIDANQGYDYGQAAYFVKNIDPANVELFEQPFPIRNWDDMVRLAGISPLPLMLDESIVSEADLEKAIELGCAQVVKVKLMRAGGFGRLERLILRAGEAGLKVVMGNGVAGDIGDYHELLVASRLIETAGEMNGFLKQESRLLANPYGVSGGAVELPGGYVPRVDWEKVGAYTLEASRTDIPVG